MKKFYRNIIILSLFLAGIVILATYLFKIIVDIKARTASEENFRSYHIMVVGKYENQLFMQEVFNGARSLEDNYDAIVEFYVPNSNAENKTLKELFDYSGLLNVDGIIAYVDSEEELEYIPARTDGSFIPVVTTGMFLPSVNQISYIGTSWWEVGKKIADQAIEYSASTEGIYIIGNNSQNNPNYSSLMNSLQREIKNKGFEDFEEIPELDKNFLMQIVQNSTLTPLLICATEGDTLKTAQVIADLRMGDKTTLIGYGNSEVLMLYLNNGVIKELVCVDSENIGETAMNQLHEYRIKGYANSYVAADVKVIKGGSK